MKILAIDTSCDETSVAVTEGVRVLSSVVSTQVRYHKKYGGVVPMLAGRLHEERIASVIELALNRSKLTWPEIGAIAVTYGPGLAPALQVGIAHAKRLSLEKGLPLYAVNHMAGHIASCYAQTGAAVRPLPEYPSLALLLSGGHSELAVMRSFGDFQIIGQTLDDALGEAYDKVGKMLGLGYPGGKLVAKFAETGNEQAYALPVPMKRSGDFNFSYSGLKNAVRLVIQSEEQRTKNQVADVCASFERVAQASVLQKTEMALAAHPETRQLLLAGGVAANMRLRKKLRALAHEFGVAFLTPATLSLCTDNAGMIGVAAYFGIENGQKVAPEALDRIPYLTLED